MSKLKQLILLAALVAFVTGCHNSLSLPVQGFENCYQDNYNGIDTIIQIDGLYELVLTFDGDTITKNLVFFDNGFFINRFDEELFLRTENNRYGYYNRVIESGVYLIEEDTLIAQYFDHPGGMSWSLSEAKFQILNDSSIIQLSWELVNIYEESFKNDHIIEYVPSFFKKYDNLPNPERAWIMKKKWFWCEENDWVLYKRRNRNLINKKSKDEK